MAQADSDQTEGNEAKHRHPLQRRTERQDDDEQHRDKNERHHCGDALLGFGLFAVLTFVTRPDGWVLRKDGRHNIGLQVGIRVARADVGTREVCTHLNLALAIQAVDGRDAALFADVREFFQWHEAPVWRSDSVPLEVAHGTAVLIVQTHPNPHLVTAPLQPLHLASKKPLTHLRQQRRPRHPELIGPRLGCDLQLPQATLVVVRDVLQILALKHGRLELVRGVRQGVQICAQK